MLHTLGRSVAFLGKDSSHKQCNSDKEVRSKVMSLVSVMKHSTEPPKAF